MYLVLIIKFTGCGKWQNIFSSLYFISPGRQDFSPVKLQLAVTIWRHLAVLFMAVNFRHRERIGVLITFLPWQLAGHPLRTVKACCAQGVGFQVRPSSFPSSLSEMHGVSSNRNSYLQILAGT